MKFSYSLLLSLLISAGTWAQNYVPEVGNEVPEFDVELFKKLMLKYSKEIELGDPFKEDPFNKDPYGNLKDINKGKNMEGNLDFQVDQEINDELEQFNNVEVNENKVNLNDSLDNEINDNKDENLSTADNANGNEVIEQEMETTDDLQNNPEINISSNDNDEVDAPSIDENANTRYTDFFNDSTVGQYFKEIYDKKNKKQNGDESKPTGNPEDVNAIEPDIDYQLPKYFHFPIDY